MALSVILICCRDDPGLCALSGAVALKSTVTTQYNVIPESAEPQLGISIFRKCCIFCNVDAIISLHNNVNTYYFGSSWIALLQKQEKTTVLDFK